MLSCAVSAFRSAVDLNGDSVAARYNLGIALYQSGDDNGAVTHLEKASRLAPGEPNVLQALGAGLLRLERWTQAEEAFRAALKVSPDSEFALEGIARAQRALQESAKALPSPSAISLASRRMRDGDFSGAAEAYREFLRATPDDAMVRQNLAMALLRLGRQAEARKEIEEAIRLKPDFAAAHGTLGVLCQQQGRTKQAEQHFRRAIECDPSYTAGYLNLGLTLAGQDRFTESVIALRKARELSPDNPAVFTALGMALVRQNHLEDALEALRKALELQPQSAVAHLNVGIAMADLTWQSDAIQEFDEALRLDPRLAAAHYNRGRALYELGRFEEAKASLEQATSLQAGYAPALMMLGMAESGLGRNEQAVELLQQSIALDSSNSTAHHWLGKALLDLGREEAALEHLKTAVDLNPGDSRAVYVLMRVLAARKAPEAKQYGQQLRELKREENAAERAGVLSNFALEAAEAEDWPQAIGKLREALELCGECSVRARLHKNLGLIMAQSGDNAAAVEELAIAHELDPEDRDIEYALELLRKRIPQNGSLIRPFPHRLPRIFRRGGRIPARHRTIR